MYISNETPEQTESRLRSVITAAELRVLPGEYAFVERPVSSFPYDLVSQSLALVRDKTAAAEEYSTTGVHPLGCERTCSMHWPGFAVAPNHSLNPRPATPAFA